MKLPPEPDRWTIDLVESRIGAVALETRSSWSRWLSPTHRCLNSSHRSVSDSRSSNRACRFPASGSPTGFTSGSRSRPRHGRLCRCQRPYTVAGG